VTGRSVCTYHPKNFHGLERRVGHKKGYIQQGSSIRKITLVPAPRHEDIADIKSWSSAFAFRYQISFDLSVRPSLFDPRLIAPQLRLCYKNRSMNVRSRARLCEVEDLKHVANAISDTECVEFGVRFLQWPSLSACVVDAFEHEQRSAQDGVAEVPITVNTSKQSAHIVPTV
jgi:hypothetical protein